MNQVLNESRISRAQQTFGEDSDAESIGVHVMSEFVYCSRAGTLAYESGLDDTGSDLVAAPALGGIPSFDIDEIQAELEQLTDSLKHLLTLFLSLAIVLTLIAVFDRTIAAVTSTSVVFGMVISGRLYWWSQVAAYFRNKHRLKEAKEADPLEPDWSERTIQSVQWWELLKSGFDSRELNQPLHEYSANLQGIPWRILRRGDLHLPVVRMRVADQGPGQRKHPRFREQQRARMAAYAYLVETCQRGRADWVIVLLNGTTEGVAVPIGETEWEAFTQGLIHARGELRKLKADKSTVPCPSENHRACSNCPFGRPRPIGESPTILGGVEVPPHLTLDRSQERMFHSNCGDRFQWIPPHSDAEALGLKDS